MANREITSPYSASITGCGFMYEEMRALLPMLMSSDRDLLLKEELRTGEHLMMSSERARSRAIPEFVKRYNAVPKSFWAWFLTLNDKSQRVAMFYVILKTYKIVFDLHINVVMEHWRGVEQRVTKNDLMMEFNEISARDAFVESWSENTKEKVSSSVCSILRKVGLMEEKNFDLKSVDFSEIDCSYYIRNNELWFLEACFLEPYEVQKMKEDLQ
jgi:hypothetical protein